MTVRVCALTTVNPNETEALSAYMATTTPLLEKAKAKIVVTYAVARTIVGDTVPSTVTIVEYPTIEDLESVFDSAEYGLLKEIRARAFLSYQISILTD
ncbi:DUF1330 domain-containing protein [Pseudosulfitobacter sp. SM2401]|uniref:DUF1330 domain-containing protein n=1 Tax=Pseudosulfitobacter sp. SM2401 TaxID=3350098 RepID=UPI0036F358EE